MRIRLDTDPYSPLKPTKVGFIFIGPNSVSRAEDRAAVNHVTQAVVMSWVEDWVLESGLRKVDSVEVFKSWALTNQCYFNKADKETVFCL